MQQKIFRTLASSTHQLFYIPKNVYIIQNPRIGFRRKCTEASLFADGTDMVGKNNRSKIEKKTI